MISEQRFDAAPDGSVIVELLGSDGRRHWQAHCRNERELEALARELVELPPQVP